MGVALVAMTGATEPESVESFLTVQEHSGGIPLGRILAWHAARDPHRPAVTIDGKSFSRAELDARSNRRARALAARGLLDRAELLEHLKKQIVVTKLPRGIEFVDFPLRGNDGKARRSALRQERLNALAGGDGFGDDTRGG